jgi:hypothetical protein
MTGTTSLVKGNLTGYEELEKKFIHQEFLRLADARQEKYTNETLREWVKCFWDKGMTANEVCKRVRAVKEDVKIFGKVTFNDFMDISFDGMADIIVDDESKQQFYYGILICEVCGKSITIQKKDLYSFKQVKICEHKILTEFTLKGLYGQLTHNHKEITL